ncbi:MAG: hypothetical protein ACKO24_04080 [Leptolyngbyaceae cyanobacterium]
MPSSSGKNPFQSLVPPGFLFDLLGGHCKGNRLAYIIDRVMNHPA